MNTGRVWMQLYRTALFELDADKVPDRVAEAALVTRAGELLHSVDDNIEEEQPVDDARYALHRACWSIGRTQENASQDLAA
jgi:hypothetical protein